MFSQMNNNSYNRFNNQLINGVGGYYPPPLSVNTTKQQGLAVF
jgi:hypothetical protein